MLLVTHNEQGGRIGTIVQLSKEKEGENIPWIRYQVS